MESEVAIHTEESREVNSSLLSFDETYTKRGCVNKAVLDQVKWLFYMTIEEF